MTNPEYHDTIARMGTTLEQINAAMVEFSKGMAALAVATGKSARLAVKLDDEGLQASVDEIHSTTLEADLAFDELSAALQLAAVAFAA